MNLQFFRSLWGPCLNRGFSFAILHYSEKKNALLINLQDYLQVMLGLSHNFSKILTIFSPNWVLNVSKQDKI